MLAGRAKVETYQDVTVDEADSEEEVDTTAEAKNMVQQGWDLAKQGMLALAVLPWRRAHQGHAVQ